MTTESTAAARAAKNSEARARHALAQGRRGGGSVPHYYRSVPAPLFHRVTSCTPGSRGGASLLPPRGLLFSLTKFPAAGTVLCSSQSQNGGLMLAAGEPGLVGEVKP